jgi:RimJ/RimL family protein N-acetyltransferase
METSFEGQLVRLRPIRRDDLPRFVEWVADAEVQRFVGFYRPIGLEQEERWFEGILAEKGSDHFAIETLDGRLIGSCGVEDQHPRFRSAELGILIGDREYWGKGYGSDAIRVLLRFSFGTLNLHRVHLRVAADNARGIRCYEKCGFRHEGTERSAAFVDGRYVDVLDMGVLAEEYWAAARP